MFHLEESGIAEGLHRYTQATCPVARRYPLDAMCGEVFAHECYNLQKQFLLIKRFSMRNLSLKGISPLMQNQKTPP
jgi:hypothetical protein